MMSKSLWDMEYYSWQNGLVPILKDDEMKLQSGKVEVLLEKEEKEISLENILDATENKPVDKYAHLKEFPELYKSSWNYLKEYYVVKTGQYRIRVNQKFIKQDEENAYEIHDMNDKLIAKVYDLHFSENAKVLMKKKEYNGCLCSGKPAASDKNSVWVEVTGNIAYTM